MKVLYGARIFDGERLHDDCALVVEGGFDPGAHRASTIALAAASRSISAAGF